MLFPGWASSSRIIALKTSPRIPEKAPKTKAGYTYRLEARITREGKYLYNKSFLNPTEDQIKIITEGYTKAFKEAQEKTGVNQQPLFGMFDNNHVSLDDATTYPNSSFAGAKVFEFATSDTATEDTVLGIKVKYNTIQYNTMQCNAI